MFKPKMNIVWMQKTCAFILFFYIKIILKTSGNDVNYFSHE